MCGKEVLRKPVDGRKQSEPDHDGPARGRGNLPGADDEATPNPPSKACDTGCIPNYRRCKRYEGYGLRIPGSLVDLSRLSGSHRGRPDQRQ